MIIQNMIMTHDGRIIVYRISSRVRIWFSVAVSHKFLSSYRRLIWGAIKVLYPAFCKFRFWINNWTKMRDDL